MIRIGLVLAAGGWVLYTAGATRVGGWAVVFGLAILALRVYGVGRRGAPSGRVAPHAHAGSGYRALLRHEGGHVHAARQSGVRVERVEMRGNRGTVHLNRRDLDAAGHREYMAIMMAGRAVAGPWHDIDCSIDDGAIAAEKASMRREGMSGAEVAREVRAARADANRYARSGKVTLYAQRLEQGRQP